MGRRPLCLAALLFVFWILCTQVGNLEEKGGGLEARLTESGESRRIRVRGEVYRRQRTRAAVLQPELCHSGSVPPSSTAWKPAHPFG